MKSTVYVVILNWNGIHDTLPCLESVFASTDVELKVVVCDNASEDGSVLALEKWAAGQLQVDKPENPRLAKLLSRSAKQRSFSLIKAEDLGKHTVNSGDVSDLTVIDNGGNLGFAGGNNTGLRFALAQTNMSHVWLLNNDTLVEPDCLNNMLRRLENSNEPAVCGSRIMFYDDPSVIQCLGGNSYNRWTGNAGESLGRYLPEKSDIDLVEYEQKIDYICGASMLMPRCYLEQIGLMEDGYFLYFEEIDWATRSRGQFACCVALDSVVYHKEGSSIGSASFSTGPSLLSEFYKFRNKLKFTRRFFFYALPTCYLASWLQVLNRLRRGQFEHARLVARVLLGKEQFESG